MTPGISPRIFPEISLGSAAEDPPEIYPGDPLGIAPDVSTGVSL